MCCHKRNRNGNRPSSAMASLGQVAIAEYTKRRSNPSSISPSTPLHSIDHLADSWQYIQNGQIMENPTTQPPSYEAATTNPALGTFEREAPVANHMNGVSHNERGATSSEDEEDVSETRSAYPTRPGSRLDSAISAFIEKQKSLRPSSVASEDSAQYRSRHQQRKAEKAARKAEKWAEKAVGRGYAY